MLTGTANPAKGHLMRPPISKILDEIDSAPPAICSLTYAGLMVGAVTLLKAIVVSLPSALVAGFTNLRITSFPLMCLISVPILLALISLVRIVVRYWAFGPTAKQAAASANANDQTAQTTNVGAFSNTLRVSSTSSVTTRRQ
jgi:cbb3-type cytochrome oxidase subunit 3